MSREKVSVVEVGLRDGLQMLKTIIPTSGKQDWFDRERRAGVARFEVASFVPVKHMPQMADAAEMVRHAKAAGGLEVAVLAPNFRGAQDAAAAGADIIVMPVSASAAHSMANVRKTPDEMVAELGRVDAMRREEGFSFRLEAGIATAFGCTLQGEVSEVEVVRLAEAAIAAGADEVGLADTVGYATPNQVRRLFRKVMDAVGHRINSAHFHDTRGVGLANVVAALDVGIRSFDASLGGLGGCPHAPGASGNIATEDLVFMLESMGFDTGIDMDAMIEASRYLSALLPGQTLFGVIAGAGLPVTYPGRGVAA